MNRLGLCVVIALVSAAGAADAGPSVPGYEVVVGETPVDSFPSKQLQVNCPRQKRALGAGWGVLDPTGAILEGFVTYSEPAWDGSHWLVNAQNLSSYSPTWKLRVRVICAYA